MTRRPGLRASVRAMVLGAVAGTVVACSGDTPPDAASPTVTAPPATAAPDDDAPAGGDAGRLSGELWLNPEGHAVVAQAEAEQAGDEAAAEEVAPLAEQPTATWFANPGNPFPDVEEVSLAAAAEDEVPVLVAYFVPLRDCRSYSAGGAADADEYLSWIGSFAAALGDRPAIVVLEPDAVPQAIVGCEGLDPAARYELLGQAVEILDRQPGARVYIDAGNASWIKDLPVLADALRASNVDQADGFSLNVSNFETTEVSADYGLALSQQLEQGAPPGEPTAHFVIDTSRNGQGPWSAPAGWEGDPEVWCNPPDRGLGIRPTTDTGNPLIDAYLWIKVPGESDGRCFRGTAGPEDPIRGMQDPEAGQWFPEQARELLEFANPPVAGS